ncbi:MAG: Uncharacterized protein Athens071416_259 [Parcubacteria group bacterium Athens0714_16]|nr:MAG: Uncharacterized protein Athens071416_259 [Parcubacteria group bacterium Athens0714_16]
MKDKKDRAFELRKNGHTYAYISEILGVPKSTLSDWFAHHPWSEEIRKKNSIVSAKRNIQNLNEKTKNKLKEKYKKAEKEAEMEFKKHKNNPLFVAGLMLYIGEGDKNIVDGMIRISNFDPNVLKIFMLFLDKFFFVKKEKVKFWILLYPDLNEKTCKVWWKNKLQIGDRDFYKNQIIKGKHKKKRLQYGVGNIILSNKFLKKKLLRWIDLISEHIAGMV